MLNVDFDGGASDQQDASDTDKDVVETAARI
eukprot:COSAG02_NODE_48280_length_335_cov_0.521186_1_plen_30_part_01